MDQSPPLSGRSSGSHGLKTDTPRRPVSSYSPVVPDPCPSSPSQTLRPSSGRVGRGTGDTGGPGGTVVESVPNTESSFTSTHMALPGRLGNIHLKAVSGRQVVVVHIDPLPLFIFQTLRTLDRSSDDPSVYGRGGIEGNSGPRRRTLVSPFLVRSEEGKTRRENPLRGSLRGKRRRVHGPIMVTPIGQTRVFYPTEGLGTLDSRGSVTDRWEC